MFPSLIPNEFHFIFGLSPDFGGRPFSLVHYVAIAACQQVNKPTRINMFYEYLPQGEWWERARPMLTLRKVRAPDSIHGRPIVSFAHKADVMRLHILKELGGVYLDIDVICIEPFTDLRHNDCVLGEELGVGLCNAVILSKPEATFISLWLAGYSSFSNGQWNEHSVKLPSRLAQGRKDICVLGPKIFFWPMWNRKDDLSAFYTSNKSLCEGSYCVHLWESITWPLIGKLTIDTVRTVDSEFCHLLRPYV